jgi:hypothetical protein
MAPVRTGSSQAAVLRPWARGRDHAFVTKQCFFPARRAPSVKYKGTPAIDHGTDRLSADGSWYASTCWVINKRYPSLARDGPIDRSEGDRS